MSQRLGSGARREGHDTFRDDVSLQELWVDPRSESREGEVLSLRYHLGQRIGQGTYGDVYEARDLQEKRPVAVKLLHAHLGKSREHTARFSREVRALSALAHPAVVRVFDAGQDPYGLLYIVMELLEGEILGDRLARAPLGTRDIAEIGRQLLAALASAHDQGIVHRDIKPENLLLASEPSGGLRLRVLDFGLAKLLWSNRISFETGTGLILGTPHYMSPEMFRGKPVTLDVDLWGAAAVLFRAFTGTPPFDEENLGRLLLRNLNDRAPSLASRRPDLPPGIIAAIDRALDPDVDARFRDARSFAEALVEGALEPRANC